MDTLMTGQPHYERNDAAYQRMKQAIAQSYPRGWFVAIGDDKVLGAAATFRELESALRASRIDPRNVLIVEADVAYPDSVTILVSP